MLTTAVVLLGVALEVTVGQFTIKEDGGAFSFGSSTFAATGALPAPSIAGNWPALLGPFELGSGVSTSGTQAGNGLGAAVITLEGVVHDVNLGSLMAERGSWFTFAGPTLTITGAGVYHGAFTFSGSICGVAPGAPSGVQPCIVDLPELFGHGSVALSVVLDSLPSADRPLFRTDSLVYSFAASEVPEPAAWLLLLAGVPLVRRRRSSTNGR
jgi:MYXO-CTERM domain-containing protein